ncbi:MAG: hypothetical protein QXW39_03490 [Candidatus Bathyarchaeia archaeon]
MSVLDKETLEVIYRPSYKAAKRTQSAAAGNKTVWRRMSEGIILLSEKCPNCGKTARGDRKEMERRIINIIVSDTVKTYKPTNISKVNMSNLVNLTESIIRLLEKDPGQQIQQLARELKVNRTFLAGYPFSFGERGKDQVKEDWTR